MVISRLLILIVMMLIGGLGPGAAAEKPATLRALKQAVAANPQDYQAHYALGLKYESLGKTRQAVEEYQTVLRLHPDDAKALYRLGGIMGRRGETGQAIDLLKKAVKLNPDSAQARAQLAATYNQQGMAQLAHGRLDDARDAWEAGIQANGGPAETEALKNNLGCLYVRENRLDQATDTFREVLRQNPAAPEAHYNLALIYYAQGNYQAANREFFSLKGLDPDLAGQLAGYRFRIETSPEVAPPVKSLGFKGSPLLTQGVRLPSSAR